MRESNRAPFYVCLYAGLSEIARSKGYCLSIHGSVITDMDLLAVPWVETASSAEDLMEALKDHLGAVDYRSLLQRDCEWANEKDIDAMMKNSKDSSPERKPHGRLAWNLYLYHGCRIDLSVMPRKFNKPTL